MDRTSIPLRMLEMKASLTATLVLFLTLVAKGQSPQVTVVPDSAGWTLVRNGEELSIRGAGAKSHFDLLDDSGANSIRLWSTNKSALLDSAHQRGMTVMLGLYLRPERTGMDYNDEYAVQGQIEELKQEILKYKDHPALLIWGIGNEVDLKYTNTRVWDSVEELAMFIHQVDPNHPTSTVLAGIDPAKIHMVKSHCPSVDILGVNAYGGIEKLPLNIRRFGWEKPISSQSGASTALLKHREHHGERRRNRREESRHPRGCGDTMRSSPLIQACVWAVIVFYGVKSRNPLRHGMVCF